jgi:triacylglycerol lipase
MDIEIAKLCAEASQCVYSEDKSEKSEKLKSIGFNLVQFFEGYGTEAFIASNREQVLLAFRGTEPDSLRDLGTDINIMMVHGACGSVHRGFHNAVTKVWSPIETEIRRQVTAEKALYITGHSMGGAEATDAAARLEFDIRPVHVSGVYTFGSPRLFSRLAADNYNRKCGHKTNRFVNNNDVVTRVPTKLRCGHAGKLCYFDHDGVLHFGDTLMWWTQFWDRIEGRLEAFLDLSPFDGISDNSMSKYLENINRA